MKNTNIKNHLNKNLINLRLLLAAFIINLIFTDSCYSSRIKNEISTNSLIRLFMLNENDDSTLLDWSTGAEPSSPIQWQNSGIVDCDTETQNKFGVPFCRIGKVVITENGKPLIETLEKNIVPGKWIIKLAGTANGYLFVIIESEVLNGALPLNNIKTLSVKKYRCRGSMPADQGNQIYKITKSGKKPIYLNESWFCGAKNCSFEYTFYYDKETTDKEACL